MAVVAVIHYYPGKVLLVVVVVAGVVAAAVAVAVTVSNCCVILYQAAGPRFVSVVLQAVNKTVSRLDGVNGHDTLQTRSLPIPLPNWVRIMQPRSLPIPLPHYWASPVNPIV